MSATGVPPATNEVVGTRDRDARMPTSAAHNWSDWYVAYMNARESGRTPEEASDDAGDCMEEALHVLPR
jgi:hypothetical protein